MGRISFQKRQKEMKRQEKQRMKAEKRALRKIEKNATPKTGEGPGGPQIGEVIADETSETP